MKILILGACEKSAVYIALSRLEMSPSCLDDLNALANINLEEFSAVFITGEFITTGSHECVNAAGTLCKRCGELEIPVLFDPDSKNISGADSEVICKIAALSEVFIPASEDAKALCGLDDPERIAEHFIALGTRKVVVTLDKKGAFYKSAKESGYAPTFRADKVVDTSGAGSAFAAGLISGIAEEIPLSEAVIRANACGCIAIQKSGELDGLPTKSQLREYMLTHQFAVDGCKEF